MTYKMKLIQEAHLAESKKLKENQLQEMERKDNEMKKVRGELMG